MRRLLYTTLLLLCLSATARAQDEAFYNNYGCNIGWSFASPQGTVLNGIKSRFDAETAFAHEPMQIGALSQGGTFGLAIFSGNAYFDFEYRALGTTGKYRMQQSATDQMQDYAFKVFQHSARFSYNYGRSFGKYGTSGVYLGAAVFAGTWGLKSKAPGSKMQRMSIDDYEGFSIGVSPQLTFRTHFVELKGYYDFPFTETKTAPMYNKLFGTAGAPDAGGDTRMKGRIAHAGVSCTFFIPFGKPSERARPTGDARPERTTASPVPFRSGQDIEREKSQDRIRDMQRDQERRERQFNEKWNR